MNSSLRWRLLQHDPFEGPGYLATWLEGHNCISTRSELWKSAELPSMDEFDVLAVLGGPMNAYDDQTFPWLALEKEFIEEAVAEKKRVLGICLGAQLLAVALGGTVNSAAHREIGWFPVELTLVGRRSRLFHDIPDRFMAFHWHSDQFSIPPDATHLASSRACDAQCFGFGDHVLGLQFHLESNESGIEGLILSCSNELVRGLYVQTPDALRAGVVYLDRSHRYFATLLDNFSHFEIEECSRRSVR